MFARVESKQAAASQRRSTERAVDAAEVDASVQDVFADLLASATSSSAALGARKPLTARKPAAPLTGIKRPAPPRPVVRPTASFAAETGGEMNMADDDEPAAEPEPTVAAAAEEASKVRALSCACVLASLTPIYSPLCCRAAPACWPRLRFRGPPRRRFLRHCRPRHGRRRRQRRRHLWWSSSRRPRRCPSF